MVTQQLQCSHGVLDHFLQFVCSGILMWLKCEDKVPNIVVVRAVSSERHMEEDLQK